MNTKRCYACRETKPLSEFSRSGKKVHSKCKACQREYSRQHYRANKADYVARAAVRNKAQRRRLQRIVANAKRGQPCADCGRKLALRAMQFDHLPGTEKIDNIADLTRKVVSEDRLRAEIAKCEIVCERCHAIRSWERRRNGVGNP